MSVSLALRRASACVALVISLSACSEPEPGLAGGPDGALPPTPLAPDAGGWLSPDSAAPVVHEDNSAWCGVQPIVAANCTVCHDGAGSAGSPFALREPADFAALSPGFPGTTIRERARVRLHQTERPMPPRGDLRAEDLAALDAWLASADLPHDATCKDAPPAEPVAPWPDDCEAVYRFVAHDPNDPSKPYRFAANSEERVTFSYDAPWGDQPIQARAMRSITDNRKVLHHWILYESRVPGSFLTGWAPGRENLHGDLPSDIGMFLPSGRDALRLEMHYFNKGPNAAEELDGSGIEICIATQPNFRPKMATVYGGFTVLGSPFVLAPARSVNHSVTSKCTINAKEPVHLLTTSPHGHKLATHMRFTIQKRGEPEIVVLDEPFSWEEQISHTLPEEIVVNTGDVVTTTCTYNNPTDMDVSYGGDTSNEMCFNYMVYYPQGVFTCDFDLIGDFFGGL